MKQLSSLAAIFLPTMLVTVSGWNLQDAKKSVGQLSKVVGVVEVRSSSTGAWHLTSVNSKIMAGSELRTKAQSFVLLTFSDNSKLLVRENSSIRIVCGNPGTANCGILVTQGNIGFDVKDSTGFEIDSPYAFAILHGGTGAVTYDSKSRTAIYRVGKGTAEITGKQKNCKLTVTAGHSATVDSAGCRVN